ncbi:MAG: HAD family phosphatase [Acidobacteriota bacterium]|nr:HAD family phosphatase [Acidobacteriota bacterium]
MAPVEILLTDVDGTLVTQAKELTPGTVAAARRLREAGVQLAVTSGRPPRGMASLVEPLDLTTPIAAFNGGLIVRPDMSVIEQRVLPAGIVEPAIDLLDRSGLDVWAYSGADWLVRDAAGAHVAHEAGTVGFGPTVVESFGALSDVAKLVGVSDDHELVGAATAKARETLGDHVSASQSQPYYLDITHPRANKGEVVSFLSATLGIAPERFATIGDMPNDVLMFARSGLSIAMGNAAREVQRAARRVTTSNEDEGFARAVERFVLPAGA